MSNSFSSFVNYEFRGASEVLTSFLLLDKLPINKLFTIYNKVVDVGSVHKIFLSIPIMYYKKI